MSGVPPFWQNHTLDQPFPWEKWSDLIQLALRDKENIDPLWSCLYLIDPLDRIIETGLGLNPPG